MRWGWDTATGRWVRETGHGGAGLAFGLARQGSGALVVTASSYLLSPMFLSPVLATGPTLSMGLLVTVAVSGTSSSAPVGPGNIQKPFGRYF